MLRPKNFLLKMWLCLVSLVALGVAQTPLPVPVADLRRLRDQLKANASAQAPDVLVLVSETAVNLALQQLTGLEIKLANGARLTIKSAVAELHAAEARVRLEVQARALTTLGQPLSLQVNGRLRPPIDDPQLLRLPLEVTEVKVGGVLAPVLKVIFGEWLSPQRWNAAVPALEYPRALSQVLALPATNFESTGQMPMTVMTPALQVPLNFRVAHLWLLEQRLAIVLRAENGNAMPDESLAASPQSLEDAPTLEHEIAGLAAAQRLGDNLQGDELQVRLTRRLLAQMLQALAQARDNDLRLQMKGGRIREELHGSGRLQVTNYTEIETGEGQADVRQLLVEQITPNGLSLRLNAQGTFQARVRGREFGIPYRLSPRGLFGIYDRGVVLQADSNAASVWLRAVPGGQLPLDVRWQFPVAGREIGFQRQFNLAAEQLFKRLELPALWARELALPHKVAIAADHSVTILESTLSSVQLVKPQLTLQNDAVAVAAAIRFEARQNN